MYADWNFISTHFLTFCRWICADMCKYGTTIHFQSQFSLGIPESLGYESASEPAPI